MRKIMVLSAATLTLLGAASATAVAQNRTPPDTSVKALEPPIDVRRDQLRAQTPPAANSGTSTPPGSGSGTGGGAGVAATPPR